MRGHLLQPGFMYPRAQSDSVDKRAFLKKTISPCTRTHTHTHTRATYIFPLEQTLYVLKWLIFLIINCISEEFEAVSSGPSLLHLRSQWVVQQGIMGESWIGLSLPCMRPLLTCDRWCCMPAGEWTRSPSAMRGCKTISIKMSLNLRFSAKSKFSFVY